MSINLSSSDRPLNHVVFDCCVYISSFLITWSLLASNSHLSTGSLVSIGITFVVARCTTNVCFGIYRSRWRFVALPDALTLSRSTLVSTFVALLCSRLLSKTSAISIAFSVMDLCLALGGALVIRVLWKSSFERKSQRGLGKRGASRRRRTLLYGAGRAGMLLWKELQNHAGVEVVGFADDDDGKLNATILGLPVLCNRATLLQTVQRLNVAEVILSIATPTEKGAIDVIRGCRSLGVDVKVIPTLQEIVEGKVNIAEVREFQVEDVLGRESVKVDGFEADVARSYAGKCILVTGAGGSIGSELVRQILRAKPFSVILLDKDENSVYELEQELLAVDPAAPIVPVVADIRINERISDIFCRFRPHIVFHAAAHKHVPLMEREPSEAVLNNVVGTENLLSVCRKHRLERFLFISTDKAVSSTTVMGATKRIGEVLVTEFAQKYALPAACVRFGNVLNSRGSVIPLFRKQIRRGGPVTITHPEMSRYFMTIPEAAQLVLCAATLANAGGVFILEMGRPRKIVDLAREMIELSNKDAREIPIVFTGLRPGEKLSEELIAQDEQVEGTRFSKIYRVRPDPDADYALVASRLGDLRSAASDNDGKRLISVLLKMGVLHATEHSQATFAEPLR